MLISYSQENGRRKLTPLKVPASIFVICETDREVTQFVPAVNPSEKDTTKTRHVPPGASAVSKNILDLHITHLHEGGVCIVAVNLSCLSLTNNGAAVRTHSLHLCDASRHDPYQRLEFG